MSFYPQPNKYQCGPFALKYALVMLGIFTSEKSIARKAGSSWWHGTDEIGLEEAAKYYDCRFKYFRREVGQDAIKVLVQHLKRGFPCILSVDNWGHWITVINWQQGKFILMDSSKDKVIRIYSAKQLISRWKFIDPDDEFKSFDGYALIPNFKPRTRAKFTLPTSCNKVILHHESCQQGIFTPERKHMVPRRTHKHDPDAGKDTVCAGFAFSRHSCHKLALPVHLAESVTGGKRLLYPAYAKGASGRKVIILQGISSVNSSTAKPFISAL